MFEKRWGLLSKQTWLPSPHTLQCNEKVNTSRWQRWKGAGDVALLIKCLPHEHEYPGSTLSTHKKPGVVEHTCNPSSREGRELHRQEFLGPAPGSTKDLVSKNKVESDWGKSLMLTSGFHMNIRDWAHTIYHYTPFPNSLYSGAVQVQWRREQVLIFI